MVYISEYQIKKALEAWKKESGVKRPVLFNVRENVVNVYTSQPGYFIGKAGILFDKFASIIQEKCGESVVVQLHEVAYDII